MRSDIGQRHVLFVRFVHRGKSGIQSFKGNKNREMAVDHSMREQDTIHQSEDLFDMSPLLIQYLCHRCSPQFVWCVYSATSPARSKLCERLFKDGYHYDVVEQYAHQLEVIWLNMVIMTLTTCSKRRIMSIRKRLQSWRKTRVEDAIRPNLFDYT